VTSLGYSLIRLLSVIVLITFAPLRVDALSLSQRCKAWLEPVVNAGISMRGKGVFYSYFLGVWPVGEMQASAQDSTLNIGFYEVVESFRGYHIGHELVAEAIRRHPEVTEIKGMLATTNMRTYDEGRYLMRLSDEDAMKRTPIYKAAAASGFKIVNQTNSGYFLFSKPQSN